MVTKRARRWTQRGITAALVAAVLGLGTATWFTSEAIEAQLLMADPSEPLADPAAAGISFATVNVPGPLGNYPAWQTAGEEDTWVVLVHDLEGTRTQAIGALPLVSGMGFPALVVTLRNDYGGPPAEGGHSSLGDDEWADLEAAVEYALEAGARDVVVIGFGSGGDTALTLLRRSAWAERVAGVVLDSPYLDPGSMVDHRTGADNLPGFLAGWGKALATFRWGVEWALLDQIAAAGEFTTPMLLIHGTADARVPVAFADTFAAARPDLIEYLRVEGAGHLEAMRLDPEGYEAVVRRFLERVAIGPSELPEAEVPERPTE